MFVDSSAEFGKSYYYQLAVIDTANLEGRSNVDSGLYEPFHPDLGIAGIYSGTLTVTLPESPNAPIVNLITMKFVPGADSAYEHRLVDSAYTFPGAPTIICNVELGRWSVMDSSITLSVILMGPGTICNMTLIPEGDGFGVNSLRIEIGDTLKVLKMKPDSTSAEFVLVKTDAFPR